MQTFFVNTSKRRIENNNCMMDIYTENKKFIQMKCPLELWFDKEKGFEQCVSDINEMINNFAELTNNFDLLIYIDLTSFKHYSDVSVGNHLKKDACLKALRSILKKMIKETIFAMLNEYHRTPKETVIIFEENAKPKDHIRPENSEENRELLEMIRTLVGIPEMGELVQQISTAVSVGTGFESVFCDVSKKLRENAMVFDVLPYYKEHFESFYEKASYRQIDSEDYDKLLLDIYEDADHSTEEIFGVSFISEKNADKNISAKTKQLLRLYLYLIDGLSSDTYLTGDDYVTPKQIPEPNPEQWENIAYYFNEKIKTYKEERRKIGDTEKTFFDMGMLPKLKKFNKQKFAFDSYGNNASETKVLNDKEKNENEKIDRSIIEIDNLLPKGKYPEFDYDGEEYIVNIEKKNPSAEDYTDAAIDLRNHHLDFINKLKVHITKALMNYALPSKENRPPVLQKRNVNIVEENFGPNVNKKNYSDNKDETEPIELIKPFSIAVAEQSEIDYYDYCASASVAVTDIEEQTNWIINRIDAIKKNFRRLNVVFVCLIFLMFAAYIPYIFIQWRDIVADIFSIATGICSMFVPFVLVGVSFLAIVKLQKREYQKAWKEYRKKTRNVLDDNIRAAQSFDRLLKVYIPRYRWTNEYSADVKLYEECCDTASAILNHHKLMLERRIEYLRNILQDLSVTPEKTLSWHLENISLEPKDIFCSGNKNKAFYSIIGRDLIDHINRKGAEEGWNQ